jgi:hypothetical protein
LSKRKIKINDMGGTGTKVKAQADNQTVRIKHYNNHFRDVIEIPTGIFCEIAAEIISAYTHGHLDEN